MTKFLQKTFNKWNFPYLLSNWIIIIIKVILLYITIKLISFFLLFISKRYFIKKGKRDGIVYDRRQRTIDDMLNSLFQYMSWPILIIGILDILKVDTTTILTGAGIFGVAFGFAFQDLLKDIVSGFFIVIENVFSVGDYITIKDYTGTVLRIGIKSTTILSYTGEKYVISNREIANVTNFTSTRFCLTLNRFYVDLNTDFDKLYSLLQKFIDELVLDDRYIERPFLKGIDSINEYAAVIQIETKVKPMSQYVINGQLQKEILQFLHKKDIKIAYPTYRVMEVENGIRIK